MIACFDMDGGRSGAGAHASAGDSAQRGKGGGHASSPRPRRGVRTAGPVRVEVLSEGDRFEFGSPSVVASGGPHPKDHPAGRADHEIAELFARKRREREQGIERVMEQERAAGRSVERFVAAIKYDSELAPRTTNRRQLLELGIEVPAGDAIPSSDAAARRCLWTIIYGLARLGIYLTGTDGLDDREMLSKLCDRVLIDEVADIPPSGDMSEFIDLAPLARDSERNPDGLSGPFEFDPEADDDLGVRPPGQPTTTIRCDRDRFLPRPDRR